MAKKAKTTFVCQNCGAQRPRWEGKCPECGSWNSFVEETFTPMENSRGWALGETASNAKTLLTKTLDDEFTGKDFFRTPTGYAELDRVLGGGLVKGSFLLLGGSPGIGKSTLLLQMAGGISGKQTRVLYFSGEESIDQTGHRAQRLGIRSPYVTLASENNLSVILEVIRKQKPEVVIVDSIQTVFLPELTQAPGSVSQVRECAGHLMTLAKNEGISIFVVGHITKDGTLAGPKVLEHMVDCVLSFEGDSSFNHRILRSLKNRFGPTHEMGVFAMETQGLREITNPSEIFLEERSSQLMGSSVFANMEGSRPLLCEIQALTVPSHMSMPRRSANGCDINRLHLLCAVLEKHLQLPLFQSEVFVNVVGGLKISEPAADLAIACSLLSSEGHFDVDAKTLLFGEIGLTGEVRAVTQAEARVREGVRLGFQRFFIPASNFRQLEKTGEFKKTELISVSSVVELNRKLGKPRAVTDLSQSPSL